MATTKSPDNKKLWVVDEDAAAVVYEIGLYVMDGFGPSQIARKLTERRILTPAAYYASRGRKASNIKRGLPYAWDASTVADIMDRWRVPGAHGQFQDEEEVLQEQKGHP